MVFSMWRGTLDLIQSSIDGEGLRFLRVDGGITRQRRVKIFDEFRDDPEIKVLLLTISCGAEG